MLMYIHKRFYYNRPPHNNHLGQDKLVEGVKGKCCITLPCQIPSTFRSCLCAAWPTTSHRSLIPPPLDPPHYHCWAMFKSKCLRINFRVWWRGAHACKRCIQLGGCVRFKSAVSRTLMDARWKHTWSLSYVLLIEVLWHPAWPRHKAAAPLKIKVRIVCTCKQRQGV